MGWVVCLRKLRGLPILVMLGLVGCAGTGRNVGWQGSAPERNASRLMAGRGQGAASGAGQGALALSERAAAGQSATPASGEAESKDAQADPGGSSSNPGGRVAGGGRPPVADNPLHQPPVPERVSRFFPLFNRKATAGGPKTAAAAEPEGDVWAETTRSKALALLASDRARSGLKHLGDPRTGTTGELARSDRGPAKEGGDPSVLPVALEISTRKDRDRAAVARPKSVADLDTPAAFGVQPWSPYPAPVREAEPSPREGLAQAAPERSLDEATAPASAEVESPEGLMTVRPAESAATAPTESPEPIRAEEPAPVPEPIADALPEPPALLPEPISNGPMGLSSHRDEPTVVAAATIVADAPEATTGQPMTVADAPGGRPIPTRPSALGSPGRIDMPPAPEADGVPLPSAIDAESELRNQDRPRPERVALGDSPMTAAPRPTRSQPILVPAAVEEQVAPPPPRRSTTTTPTVAPPAPRTASPTPAPPRTRATPPASAPAVAEPTEAPAASTPAPASTPKPLEGEAPSRITPPEAPAPEPKPVAEPTEDTLPTPVPTPAPLEPSPSAGVKPSVPATEATKAARPAAPQAARPAAPSPTLPEWTSVGATLPPAPSKVTPSAQAPRHMGNPPPAPRRVPIWTAHRGLQDEVASNFTPGWKVPPSHGSPTAGWKVRPETSAPAIAAAPVPSAATPDLRLARDDAQQPTSPAVRPARAGEVDPVAYRGEVAPQFMGDLFPPSYREALRHMSPAGVGLRSKPESPKNPEPTRASYTPLAATPVPTTAPRTVSAEPRRPNPAQVAQPPRRKSLVGRFLARLQGDDGRPVPTVEDALAGRVNGRGLWVNPPPPYPGLIQRPTAGSFAPEPPHVPQGGEGVERVSADRLNEPAQR